MKEEKEKKKKKGSKILIILLVVIVIAAGVLAAKIYFDKLNENNLDGESNEDNEPITMVLKEKKINIFNGEQRPVAVMIDNVGKDAWPQVGFNDAYFVYEIIVEGGISRMMVLFKGTMPEEIGSIRSARPYYIDYALEHDAIFVHYGHTIKAEDDLKALDVDHIEGLYDEKPFWRTNSLYAPHNVSSSMERIQTAIESYGFRNTSTDKGFKYVADDYDLEPVYEAVVDDSELEDAIGDPPIPVVTNIANSVKVTYSTTHSTSYTYDAESKLYKRFMRGVAHTDRITKEQYTAKNIIIQFVPNSALGDTREVPDKGYQKLSNIGSGNGYFITNGKFVEITWQKTARASKTLYIDLDGNEIVLNDGITYVQITPENQKVVIE